ncbi:CorA Metal Ion Transporter (MIT) Family [Thraustotheca clavata]|uniref:CorA Metal Ion Transporter (MIT) Family n=1 Tax=Thraustotheca clavata TaxID=74557 RepID=A0A1V9ZCM1_9STRA|nr:CorA Metal Ion Transporter (MIT) Family [Thraustotheca clavata]
MSTFESLVKPSTDNASWIQVHAKSLKEIVTVDMLPTRVSSRMSDESSFKAGYQDVLKFDVTGEASLEQLRRADVLKMTQQAAMDVPSPKAMKETKENTPMVHHAMSAGGFAHSDAQCVHMRDLRKLDYAFVESYEPSIAVRKQAILINADPIRSVIMRDCCLMFVPDPQHTLVDLLKHRFKELMNDEDSEMPFEFRALEAILSTVCKFLADDFAKISPIIKASLERLASAQMSSGELETLRTLKNAMNEYESQVNGLRRVLMEVLDNEVDMHLMYLTKLFTNPVMLNELWTFDAEEAESLLEVYLQDIHSTKTKVALILHRIQNTESIVMLKMDAVRNYLLTADMIFTLIMVCMTFGMFITAAFGMNLTSGLETAHGAFLTVVLSTIVFAIVSVIAGIAFFRSRGSNWIAQQINTPTKTLIEQDFCSSHEQCIEMDEGDKKLVVKFDVLGNMVFTEMSREDVMKLVQEHVGSKRFPKDDISDLIYEHAKITPRNIRKRSSFCATPTAMSDIQLLHMRDLRKLDHTFSATNEPSITIRKQVILVNADPLRGVIMRNCCLLFVPNGADTLIQLLRNKMTQSKTEEGHIHFEFRALEAIFYSLCKMLSSDCERLVSIVSEALGRLASAQLSSGELEVLHILKNKVAEFESQITGLRRVLMELLENEQDMKLLYLTYLHEKPTMVKELFAFDSEEAEALLEAYLQDIHSMRAKIGLIHRRMINTENVVMLKMDAVRNSLLSIDTMFGLIMLCLNFAMFTASAFGMNLLSGYETTPYLFWVVFGSSVGLSMLLIVLGIRFFKRQGIALV